MPYGPIARDHDQRIRNDLVDHLLRVRIDQHPLLLGGVVQFVKTFLREMLTGIGDHEIAVINVQLLAPSRVEHRRIHRCHARDIRISLGRDIDSMRPRPFDER